MGSGAYYLRYLDDQVHPRLINEKYLKQYFPTMWDEIGQNTLK